MVQALKLNSRIPGKTDALQRLTMSGEINIFIVEDEVITSATIQQCLLESGYGVIGTADTAESALKEMIAKLPDLVILDINLIGEKNGIWLAEQINKELKIPFIFLTAHGDKASLSQAIKTRPYGYLLKPFDEDDLLESVNVALNNFSRNEGANIPEENKHSKELSDSLIIKDSLFIRQNNLYVKVKYSDILFIRADKNYLDIITETKKIAVRMTLKDIANLLPKTIFIQINRSCVTNIHAIDSVGSDFLNIKQHELTIGANYSAELLKRLSFL